MAAVAAASAELLIIGWYIFRVLLQVFLECCIYWVGFAFRNPPGTQPIARSEVYLSVAPISLPPRSPQHSWKSSSCSDSWTSCAPARLSSSCWTGGRGGGWGRGGQGSSSDWLLVRSTKVRFLATGVQVLPAEAGLHGVADRAAGAGGAPAAGPQLRAHLPALGGRVIRCSCASRPAQEPMPRRNGGSPVLPRQRGTSQGQ
ncbi:neuronatin isoform X1 [Perognathus longimembris pacificus]|uniref:neuronatin isoform X1 n=1 Tax=Perognathus longimembris pacificus TaxID=214514 RepID=UPI002019A44A|nr:neuronatin isoform X1 [Perognathus longimembris pacificus]